MVPLRLQLIRSNRFGQRGPEWEAGLAPAPVQAVALAPALPPQNQFLGARVGSYRATLRRALEALEARDSEVPTEARGDLVHLALLRRWDQAR